MLKKYVCAGYSLLELLIALSITGIVMGPTISSVIRHHNAVQRVVTQQPYQGVANDLLPLVRMGSVAASGSVSAVLDMPRLSGATYRYQRLDPQWLELVIIEENGNELSFYYASAL